MTLQELNNLRYYPKEIAVLTDHIFQVQRQSESATHIISGMPSSRSENDYIAKAVAISTDEQKKLRRLILKRQREQARAMDFISKIDDSQLRTILILRFLKGYTWVKVAMEIGGGNTASAVKKRVTRYLQSITKKG